MGNKVVKIEPDGIEFKPYSYTYADVSMDADVRRGGKMAVGRKKDVDAVKGAVKNIFTWTPGERILLPEFGNTLKRLLYEGITDLNSEQIVNECQMLMTKWEPRAKIDRLFRKDSTEDVENNQVTVIMIWHVVGLPEKYQLEISA